MFTFDEICNVGNMPNLPENAALISCAWKAGHEDVHAEFKRKMDALIERGDISALKSMLCLAYDCLPDEVEDSNLPLPGYGSPEAIWDNLPSYVKSYYADACKEDGKAATKENCLLLVKEMKELMDICMSAVPGFLCNLYSKTIDEDNDLIRCMYYYVVYDHGLIKMMGILNDIMNKEILDQEDMVMIRSCVSFLVTGSFDLGVETKGSWTDATSRCNPEIWKDVTYELSKSEGKRGKKAEIACIDDLLIGNKDALKQKILLFLEENPAPICLAYLLISLRKAEVIKKKVYYTTFHRAIEQLVGRKIGVDTPQKRFGELKTIFQETQIDCCAEAKLIIRWINIFKEVV